METETGRKWGNAMKKKCKEMVPVLYSSVLHPFCCSCSSSWWLSTGFHWFGLPVWYISQLLIWFDSWPEGLCQETLLPGLTQEYPPRDDLLSFIDLEAIWHKCKKQCFSEWEKAADNFRGHLLWHYVCLVIPSSTTSLFLKHSSE